MCLNTQLGGAIAAHERRLTAVESSAEQAHHRIDQLDKLVDNKN
jgi:hypothetical protein